jgi:hypothetical protein
MDTDFYPAVRAKIAGVELMGDFDTGAFQTFLSDEISRRGILDHLRDTETEFHLGEPYQFFSKKLSVSLLDGGGAEQTKEITVAVVERWGDTAFIKVNRERKVLFGRDLLRAFRIEIYLNSDNRITRVRFL